MSLTPKLSLLGLLLISFCSSNNTKSAEMTLKPGDPLNQEVLRTERMNISGLNLLIKGEIKGSGQLSFGYSDSTAYKTYEVREGKIEVKYEGDWYSEFCYITYRPTTETKGQLKIDGDFIGD